MERARRSAADQWVPLEDVTWVSDDGSRYLRPEVTLLYKAVLHRPKDDRDLAVTWPLLGVEQQTWLRDAVRRLYPGHDWVGLMAWVRPTAPRPGRA